MDNVRIMTDVLDGIRVVEVAGWAFVPSAGAILAEWGADVIKVEPPTGDPIRGLVHPKSGPFEGQTFEWDMFNRGKRSMALDLREKEAQDIVHRLCETADVFLTSYLPQARMNLGIDVDTVRRHNPSIVYACGSGRGPNGAEADKPGYDLMTFWSRGGVSASVTPPGVKRPVGMPAGGFGDSLSGMALAGGIAGALVKKARTGEGSLVDGSLLGTALWCMQLGIAGTAITGSMDQLASAGKIFNPLVNTYRTSDGRWIALCMLQHDRHIEGLCAALGREDLLSDQRFSTSEARHVHAEDLIAELEAIFATGTLDEWRVVLERQEGPWDVVNRVTDLADDPQAVQNGFVQHVECGDTNFPMVASPVQFDRTPPTLHCAPGFGAQTEEVLLSMGMDWDGIIAAKVSGAVF